MPASTGGRTFGTGLPAAPMKHIDAKAISKDVQGKSVKDYVYAFLFLLGLVLLMAFGIVIGSDYGFRGALLAAVVLAFVYAITLSLLKRMRER